MQRVNEASCEQRERFLAGRGRRRHRMRVGGGQRATAERAGGRARMDVEFVDVGSLQSARLLICSNPNDGLWRRPPANTRLLCSPPAAAALGATCMHHPTSYPEDLPVAA